jgi:TatD DNase family protein
MLDSHCHLDQYPDPKVVAAAAKTAGVFVVAVTNLPSHFELGRPHAQSLKRVRLALGLHPLAAEKHHEERDTFRRLFDSTSFIGEVGLDFSREGKATEKTQLESFLLVAKLLAEKPKFTTVHSRGAERAVLTVLHDCTSSPVVLHWYSGPLEVIDDALTAGHFFSINPAMISSEKGQRIISRLPRERVLTETDGPFVKIAGKPVTPRDVAIVEQFLADRWSTKIADVQATVWDNFRTLLSRVGLLHSVEGRGDESPKLK